MKRLLSTLLRILLWTRASGHDDSLHAFTFGPTSLTVSSITSAGHIDLAHFPLSEAYTAYFTDAVENHGKRFMQFGVYYVRDNDGNPVPAPPDIHDQQQATAMLRDAVQQAVRRPLVDTMPTALYFPTLFNFSSRDAVMDASLPHGIMQAIRLSGTKAWGDTGNAACFAYRLDQCMNLGLTTTECANANDVNNRANENEVITLILVIEYQKNYLHLSLHEIISASYVFPLHIQDITNQFGEDESIRKKATIGPEAFEKELREHFLRFVDLGIQHSYGYPKVTSDMIRVAVLTGEASPAAFTQLRSVIYSVLGNKVRIPDDIDPAHVAAHGAAMYAQLTVQGPNLWQGMNGQPHDYLGHDEL